VGVTGAGGARIRILGRMCRLWGRAMEEKGCWWDAMGLRWLTNLLLLGWMDVCRCLYSIVYIPSLG